MGRQARRRGTWAPGDGALERGADSLGGSHNSASQGCPTPQAQILLDCGEDNICVPDLQLEVFG